MEIRLVGLACSLPRIVRGQSFFRGRTLLRDVRSRLESGKPLAADEPHGNDADLVENHQGDGHHQLVDDIRCGRQDGGNNKINQNGILAMTIQHAKINDADLGQKDHQHRHLKDDPEGNQQANGQGKVFADRRQRHQKFIAVTDEKTKGGRKDDIIAENRATQKEDGRKKGKGQKHTLLMSVQAGGQKTPDLIKDNRAGQQQPTDQGELQIKKNPSWYEVKISDEPSGKTAVKGLKNQAPMGSTKPYEAAKPAITAAREIIRQERSSRR